MCTPTAIAGLGYFVNGGRMPRRWVPAAVAAISYSRTARAQWPFVEHVPQRNPFPHFEPPHFEPTHFEPTLG